MLGAQRFLLTKGRGSSARAFDLSTMKFLSCATFSVLSSGAAISCSQIGGSAPPEPRRGADRPSTLTATRTDVSRPVSRPDSTFTTTHAEVSRPVSCLELSEIVESPPKEKFSAHGYAARVLAVPHGHAGGESVQCVVVAWPKRGESNAGKPSRVSEHIHDAWFVAIQNTLRRVPAHHAKTLRRVVIDNHPTQHGIAAFDRKEATDGRDGHTIWLSEHLFSNENHWERGVRGDYFAYHASVDGIAIHDLPSQHDVFSPVLLHELGHLVMYHVVQPKSDSLSPPQCARTCSDEGSCAKIPIEERERPCISPYCRPFKYMASTENWAEQYRFFYQSSLTRELLARAAVGSSNCLPVLEKHDIGHDDGQVAPWLRGLPNMDEFRPSRWDSCGGKACKPW